MSNYHRDQLTPPLPMRNELRERVCVHIYLAHCAREKERRFPKESERVRVGEINHPRFV